MPEALTGWNDAATWWPLAAVAVAAGVTYAWRALGVILSGRIDPQGPVFEWAACITYALMAGLVARMIVLPRGPLADTLLSDRLLAVAATLVAFFLLSRRNLLLGVAVGAVALAALTWLRGGVGG